MKNMQLPHKILVVDDDAEDQEILLDIIHELYPSCIRSTAMNGAEALEYIEKNPPPPSLVFLDLNMPLVNGFEFLVTYKKNPDYQKSHVVIYSTSSHPRDKKLAKELGATDFINKVANASQLRKNIIEVIQRIADLKDGIN
jgi:CheY-like chemotaxis protein